MSDELLTAAEVAAEMRRSEGSLANMRSAGIGPEFVKVGRSVRYRRSAVDAWVAACTENSVTGRRHGDAAC
jgi:predicted DNA-binding transcriptional regulator AlpA